MDRSVTYLVERLQSNIAQLTTGIELAKWAWSAYRDSHTAEEYADSMLPFSMLIATAQIELQSMRTELEKLEVEA